MIDVNVSVVIPAFDASATLSGTLESLLAQTHPCWEAIVIDDGSGDLTTEIARAFSERDSRIRLLRSEHSGVSRARNLGIREARFEWLLFLDSDDWLTPRALEAFADVIGRGEVDAVYGAWCRVAADGTLTPEPFRPSPDRLFETLAKCCPFATHSCVVHRRLVDRSGGFDPRYSVCEDWDFWQRVARAGARFLRIETDVARYRMRSGSAVLSPKTLLENGLEIIDRGHDHDPRVRNSDPRFAVGCGKSDLPAARLAFVCWPAGMLLGGGQDPRGVLDAVSNDRDPEMNATGAAASIFQSAALARCVGLDQWPRIWLDAESNIAAFLDRLEEISGTPMLARRAMRELEKMIVDAAAERNITIGRTATRRVEVTSPIRDVVLTPDAEWLRVDIAVQGDDIGTIELPVCDGIVPQAVLRDAIVAHHAWPILGRFFARTVYRSIRLTDGTAWRGRLQLSSNLPLEVTSDSQVLHDAIGWVVFLQELWGQSDWAVEQFYKAPPDSPVTGPGVAPTWRVEASSEVPAITAGHVGPALVLAIGAAPVAVVRMPPSRSPWPRASVIGACTREGGYEMCRVAVREAVLGAPFEAPGSLRDRLAAAAGRQTWRNDDRKHVIDARSPALDGRLGVGWREGLALDSDEVPAAALIGHRRLGVSGTSASRRAHLPRIVGPVMADLAVVDGEPVLASAEPARWLYAPGVIWSDAGQQDDSGRPTARERAAHSELSGHATSRRLPILMYHRIAPSVGRESTRYRVDPDRFAEQLGYLRESGFCSVSFAEWRRATDASQPLPGRCVALTFDDGFRDFSEHAWPLLRRYGFGATLFVVSDFVGGTSEWDACRGETAALLSWDELRVLHAAGAEIGSHSASHSFLTALSPADVVREATVSRAVIQREIGTRITAFAYPHGAEDPAVQHLIGACGYLYGLSCRPGANEMTDPLLALRRIEVRGDDAIEDFIRKLES